MNGAPKLTSALLLAALVWLFSASGTFGQPIDPFIYLREHYDYLAVILNPHPEWGDIVGADGSADGEEYAVLYDRGNIEFYEEGTNRPLRVITTRGRTGVTLIPHCEPGCIAVSDDSGIDFYDAEGNWILRREVQGGPLPGLGIIDIDYDTQWNRLVVCTESVIGWLRDDNRLEVLHQSGGFKGVEVIDMESDPLTYDMLQREHYFNKFDLAGQISDPRTFETDLGLGATIEGIAYTNNRAYIATQGALVVYDKLEFQDHMQVSASPEVTLISPPDGHRETQTHDISFEYQVDDPDSGIQSCGLILDRIEVARDTEIEKGVPQTFNHWVANGGHRWQVCCTDTTGREGVSAEWMLYVHVGGGDPINPLIYVDEEYIYIDLFDNPHPERGDYAGADGFYGDQYAVLWENGVLAFYNEQHHKLKEFGTWGTTGVTWIPSCDPACVAVSDENETHFYTEDGAWVSSREVIICEDLGPRGPSVTIRDIDYDFARQRLVIGTEEQVGWLRGDDCLIEIYEFGGSEAIEMIDMESDPLTDDMINLERFFHRVDQEGNVLRENKETNLGLFSSMKGIAYTDNYAFIPIDRMMFVYDKLRFQDHMEPYRVLIVDEPGTRLWGNIDEYDAVYVINGGSIVVPEAKWVDNTWEGGYLMLEADTIYVDADSAIHADACGFSKDDGHSEGGPGRGDDHFHSGGPESLKSADGAGYGGRGGHYLTTIGNGGDPYGIEHWNKDDPHVDRLFGSSGGDLRWEQFPHIKEFGPGGRGGGYIRLRGDAVNVEGTVTANGGDGQPITIEPRTFGGGGGSGGQLVFDSPSLTITGTVEAKGGDGSYPSALYSGGGGAGGRVKVLRPSTGICDGKFSVSGGIGCGGMGNGERGKAYFADAPASPAPTELDLLQEDDTGRSDTDHITKIAKPRITGKAPANATIRLYEGEDQIGTGQSDRNGDFVARVGIALPDGPHTIKASAQEHCHSESPISEAYVEITIDTKPPDPPSEPDMIEQGNSGGRFLNDNIVSTPTPLFRGTAEPDSDVTLYEAHTPLGAVLTPDGNWEITSKPLDEGVHQVSAKAADAAGNESQASTALEVTIDLTAPEILDTKVTPEQCRAIGQVFELELTARDALSGMENAWRPEAIIRMGNVREEVKLDHVGGDVYCGPWDSEGFEAGTYAVDFKAYDLAGNLKEVLDAEEICLADPIFGDFDLDLDVDLKDYAAFAACLTGPDTGPIGPECKPADFDEDEDVDLVDVGGFMLAFTGGQ